MPRSHRRRVLPSLVPAAIAVLGLASSTRSEIVLQTFPGTATNLRFGRSVGGGGDVDGDGHPDVIVGGANSSVAGRVRVYSGATGAVLFDLSSSDPMESFGAAVCIVGDVDGDGHADFAVGIPDWNGTPVHAGQVRIYSGADGSILQTFTGDNQADGLGATLAPAGDVDGDGYPDLIVGAPASRTVADYAGLVRVYSGHTGATLFTFYGDKTYDGLGMSVCGVGDVDGDGHADVLAGAWEIGSAGLASGFARLYSGADGSILVQVHGLNYQDRFGTSVAAVGDLDGDGVPDFAVGAPDNDAHGSNAGMVRVFSGRSGGVIRTLYGPAADAEFGISLASPGDLDGDGLPELLVGAWQETVGTATKAGTVRLFRGSDGGVFEVYRGYDAFDGFGVSVAATGDVDGDGRPDFVVGIPGDDPQGAESGSARLLSGRLSSATNYCIAAPNSAGPGATIGYTGSLSIGSNTFTLTAVGVPGNVFGLFFYGPAQASVPFANGYRCVGGQVSRLHSGHAVNGVLTRSVDFTNLPVHGVITPASTWNFQCYYRDPSAAPFFSNLSDGLSVLFSL